ncbi:MAG: hypothetical protein MRJ67_08710 [Nitrospirales bacterium]|nr:hypothetical protein [Nitrospirales bacterium]
MESCDRYFDHNEHTRMFWCLKERISLGAMVLRVQRSYAVSSNHHDRISCVDTLELWSILLM